MNAISVWFAARMESECRRYRGYRPDDQGFETRQESEILGYGAGKTSCWMGTEEFCEG